MVINGYIRIQFRMQINEHDEIVAAMKTNMFDLHIYLVPFTSLSSPEGVQTICRYGAVISHLTLINFPVIQFFSEWNFEFIKKSESSRRYSLPSHLFQ